MKGKWFERLDMWMEKYTEPRRNGQGGEKKVQRSPPTDNWTADFMTRSGESRECIHKWLKCRGIPWKRRRRSIQVSTGTFPCGQWLNEIGGLQGRSIIYIVCAAIVVAGCRCSLKKMVYV